MRRNKTCKPRLSFTVLSRMVLGSMALAGGWFKGGLMLLVAGGRGGQTVVPVIPGVFCSVVAGWILQGTAVHKTCPKLWFYVRWWWWCSSSKGALAWEGHCADKSTTCNTGVQLLQSTITGSNLFCASTRVRKRSGSILFLCFWLVLF